MAATLQTDLKKAMEKPSVNNKKRSQKLRKQLIGLQKKTWLYTKIKFIDESATSNRLPTC